MIAKRSSGLVALVAMLAFGTFVSPVRAAADDTSRNGKSDKKERSVTKNAEAAKNRQPGKGNKARAETRRATPVPTNVVIDQDGHRRVVHEYVTRETLPPGLAKRESLPPGLSKQLRERGRLPPGLQKRLTPVPPALGSRLPAVPPYYSRYFAGRDLVVVDTRTGRIVSVIRDILQ